MRNGILSIKRILKAILSRWRKSKLSALGSVGVFFVIFSLPLGALGLYEVHYLWVIFVSSLSLAIVAFGVEECLRLNDIKYEEEQAIQLKIKEDSASERLVKATEACACLTQYDRYEVIYNFGGPMYGVIVPDFIHDLLDIPEEKRRFNTSYLTYVDRGLLDVRSSETPVVYDNKYRPSAEAMRTICPTKLMKIFEDTISLYVDPLTPRDISFTQYEKHACALVNWLEKGKFNEMSIARKAFNRRSQR